MRKITTIVIHHSATSQAQTNQKTLQSIDREHSKLHKKVGKNGWHIAYHFIIMPDGIKIETRDLDEVGYHAGNFPVNLDSIGICLIGNFQHEKPTEKQERAFRNLLKLLIRRFPSIEDIKLHKEVRIGYTPCPGAHITHDYIQGLLKTPSAFEKVQMIKERFKKLFKRNS